MTFLPSRNLSKVFLILFSVLFLYQANVGASAENCSRIFSKTTNTLFSPISSRLDESIASLTQNSSIPSDYYRIYDVNNIAKAIIKRVSAEEQKYTKEFESDPKLDLIHESDIILFFWATDLESIVTKGFLNQHETKKSNGYYNPTFRQDAEDHITGLKLGTIPEAAQIRPKSAFLNIKSDVTLSNKSHQLLGQYGNIGAVMKTNLKNRSLWCACDSLGIGENGPYSADDLLKWRGSFARDSISTKKNYSSYYEAIIYGRVGVEDVDYFLISDISTLSSLKPLGIPVYSAKINMRNDRVIFEKGDLLFEGQITADPRASEAYKDNLKPESTLRAQFVGV
jgi:hypothetical protein